MTRKKWLKLRRTRPELFNVVTFQSWETMTRADERKVVRCSKQRCIEVISAYLVAMKLKGEAPQLFRRSLVGLSRGTAEETYIILHKRMPQNLENAF